MSQFFLSNIGMSGAESWKIEFPILIKAHYKPFVPVTTLPSTPFLGPEETEDVSEFSESFLLASEYTKLPDRLAMAITSDL
jgi:hypothetical protein